MRNASDLTEEEVELLMIRAEMERVRELGKWNDRWLVHPISDMREPIKMICWLTDIESPQKTESNERHNFNALRSCIVELR